VTTIELPLSAFVTMALLLLSFSLIDCIVRCSCFASRDLRVCSCSCCRDSCFMCLAIRRRMPSYSCVGRRVVAVSASRASVCSQFLCL
jgi:hypothetical protein